MGKRRKQKSRERFKCKLLFATLKLLTAMLVFLTAIIQLLSEN